MLNTQVTTGSWKLLAAALVVSASAGGFALGAAAPAQANPNVAVTFRVLLPNGSPANGVPVTLTGNGASLQSGSTRADGTGAFYNQQSGLSCGISVSIPPNRCPNGRLLSGFGARRDASLPGQNYNVGDIRTVWMPY